jgi:hypothetical protein
VAPSVANLFDKKEPLNVLSSIFFGISQSPDMFNIEIYGDETTIGGDN